MRKRRDDNNERHAKIYIYKNNISKIVCISTRKNIILFAKCQLRLLSGCLDLDLINFVVVYTMYNLLYLVDRSLKTFGLVSFSTCLKISFCLSSANCG